MMVQGTPYTDHDTQEIPHFGYHDNNLDHLNIIHLNIGANLIAPLPEV